MRAWLAAFLFSCLAGAAFAANLPPIGPNQARQHVGACMTVEGHASMFPSEWRAGTNVNLDQGGDNSGHFLAFVPAGANIPALDKLDGEAVAITGTIFLDQGRPEILLTNPDLISVAGSDPGKLITCDQE